VASIIVTSFSANIHSNLFLEAAKHGVALIICEDFKPTSLVLPANRSTDTLLTRALLKLDEKTVARLWQATVDAKCRNQFALAEHLAPDDPALTSFRAAAWGRKPHKEAICAKMFWQVFGRSQNQPEFSRERAGGGLNNLLNYGYAVLLSTILQKLFGVGLDPTWGISHAPRERSTPLAYDLMEPFRPCVDWRVVQWVRRQGGEGCAQPPDDRWQVTPEFRKWVTGFPLERVEYLDLALEVRGCIEGVVRGFRRAVLTCDPKPCRPWTPKNSKWAG
jgi:CRISPR-associated protein Cas1